MNKNKSVETIDSPEFINITPCNPMVSKCQIKVLYVGKNRNGSFISKETAKKMADTLPTCPIVGCYIEKKEDFGDHGEVITIEDDEIKFSCKTKPYGFVAPDAKVWFQKYTDTDEFGNDVEHEYLMTEGYLWTGQFEEAQSVIDNGKGQSMELDNNTLDGHWSRDTESGLEFFIINDAVFSKLCILGDDVEPCFEGASVTAPKEYSADNSYSTFARTLFTMMNELKDIISNEEPTEGGLDMDKTAQTFEEVAEEEAVEETTPVVEEEKEPVAEEPAPETVEEQAEEENVPQEPAQEESTVEEQADPEPEFSLTQLVAEVESLRKQNASLQSELDSLKEFKLKVENDEKDALIGKYFMLTDEDKADVIEHKAEYTIDEIEAKLALAYVKKNVNFSVDDAEDEKDEEPALSFSLDDVDESSVDSIATDPVIEALRDYRRETQNL